jgi:hypothetical protein
MSDENNKPEVPEAEDDLLLESIRLKQDFISTVGAKRILTAGSVAIRRPRKEEWIRVRAGCAFDVWGLELKAEGELFFLSSEVAEAVLELAMPVRLRLAISSRASVFIWPTRLPNGDQRRADTWRESALAAAQLGEQKWIRIIADRPSSSYMTLTPSIEFSPPEWPEEDFKVILKLALAGRQITDTNHPIIRELLGLGT